MENLSSYIEMENEVEDVDLYNLLNSWNLSHLYNIFYDQKINIQSLEVLQDKHVDRLFQNLAIGDQALFEYNFNKWKKNKKTHTPENVSIKVPLKTLNNTNMLAEQEPQYSLENILNETKSGKMLLKYYHEKNRFHEEQRNILINTIARYIDANMGNISLERAAKIENEILEIFPTEKLEFYTTGKRGRIYNKVANLKRAGKLLAISNESSTVNEHSFNPEENAEYIVSMMRSEDITAEDFTSFWKQCFQYRSKTISESKSTNEILQKWPEYRRPSGYRFIDIDFSLKYVDSSTLLTKWEENVNKLVKLMQMKIIAAGVSSHLQQLSSLKEDSRDLSILWFLHYLFPPTTSSITNSCGETKRRRFTICDSQESFILIGKTSNELENKFKIFKLQKANIQPCLLIVGELNDVKEIFVYFDEIRYPILRCIRAADTCFKIFFIFNLNYPEESSLFYNFVQNFFYNVDTKRKSTRISTIINDLNSI